MHADFPALSGCRDGAISDTSKRHLAKQVGFAKINIDLPAPNQLALHLEPGKIKVRRFELFSCKQISLFNCLKIMTGLVNYGSGRSVARLARLLGV